MNVHTFADVRFIRLVYMFRIKIILQINQFIRILFILAAIVYQMEFAFQRMFKIIRMYWACLFACLLLIFFWSKDKWFTAFQRLW